MGLTEYFTLELGLKLTNFLIAIFLSMSNSHCSSGTYLVDESSALSLYKFFILVTCRTKVR